MFRARGMASERMSPPPPWAADAPDRPGRSRRRLLQRQDRRDSVRAVVLLDHRPPACQPAPSRHSPRRPRSLVIARRHRDRRWYPSGQPGEDAASIAAVAPTREVADGDALPRGRRGACASDPDCRSPPTPSPMRRAGSTASWVTRGVLFGHSRTSAALLDGETVVDGSLTSVGGGGGTRRATPAADLGVARRPGRSHATRGGCSELGEQKSRPFRTILMIRDCRGAPCSQLRW